MITITKEGIEFKKYKTCCGMCGSEMEFDESDIKYNEDVKEHYIICPHCGDKIYYEKFIPINNESEDSKTPLDVIKEEILDEFDFEKVKKVMDILDWRWVGCNGVPTLEEIKNTAMELVEDAYSRKTTIATGGFKAVYHFYKDEEAIEEPVDEESVELIFYIEDVSPYVDKDNLTVSYY